ncbi:IclR family transcriptional regulator [Blastococcus saxobsidens]|uniref:IclR family transcriptional regulator n=1 Tax=Blastococcus saxobsidens TaxID=138336 RepID=UPI0005A1FA83|nr:IclR family transcriptional regulator [Blastococcus saxobsidens]
MVERTIDVLLALADGPSSFGVMSQRTELSKATLHRILGALSHQQFVVQDPVDGKYMLGAGCYRLMTSLTLGRGGIGTISRPGLERLQALCGETIVVHVRAGRDRICVEELASPHPLRYVNGVGLAAPLHVGSAGKVLLAWLDEYTLEQILPVDLPRLTEQTVVDRATLREELKLARQQGWAQSAGERVVGAAAISAPVFGANSEVVASVSILGPSARLTDERLHDLKDPLLNTAQWISRQIQAIDAGAGPTEAI